MAQLLGRWILLDWEQMRLGFNSAFLLCACACSPKPSVVPLPEPVVVRPPPVVVEPETVEPEGCRSGGEAWDGRHEGCIYEVGACCYPSPKLACEAAQCEAGACQILESSPAQIRCVEPSPTHSAADAQTTSR